MLFEGDSIRDPLISAAGRAYSLGGLRRLLTEICRNRVDNPMLLCRETTRRKIDHGRKQRHNSGKQR